MMSRPIQIAGKGEELTVFFLLMFLRCKFYNNAVGIRITHIQIMEPIELQTTYGAAACQAAHYSDQNAFNRLLIRPTFEYRPKFITP